MKSCSEGANFYTLCAKKLSGSTDFTRYDALAYTLYAVWSVVE